MSQEIILPMCTAVLKFVCASLKCIAMMSVRSFTREACRHNATLLIDFLATHFAYPLLDF